MNCGRFLTPIQATPLADGKNWRMGGDLIYEDPEGMQHVTPKGFVTDWASIPELSRLAAYVLLVAVPLLAAACWIHLVWLAVLAGLVCVFSLWVAWVAPLLNNDDQLDAPAGGHDKDYQTLGFNKFVADLRLFLAMGAPGPERTPSKLWKRWLVYFNVSAFGWKAYWDDQKRAKDFLKFTPPHPSPLPIASDATRRGRF